MLKKNNLIVLFLIPLLSLAQQTTYNKNKTEIKTKVVDSSFIIASNPKKEYHGFFKENKPYNGYFKVKINDFFWVDFYKNGEKTTQYSYDILTTLNEEEKEIRNQYFGNSKKLLDITSNFKNGKIVEGEIIEKIKNGRLSKKYSNSKFIELNADVFAMHYFNRLTVKVIEDKIVSSNFRDSISKVEVSKKGNKLLIKLVAKDRVLASNNLDNCSQENPKPNSIIRIFKIKERTECLVVEKNDEIENYADNLNFLKNLMLSYDTSVTKNKKINHVLEYYVTSIKTEDNNNTENTQLIAYIFTNKKGNIEEGIYWQEDKNNIGKYTIYKDNKVIETKKNSLENFKNTLDIYFKNR